MISPSQIPQLTSQERVREPDNISPHPSPPPMRLDEESRDAGVAQVPRDWEHGESQHASLQGDLPNNPFEDKTLLNSCCFGFQVLCGTEPYPEHFRAKKYRLHDKFFTKSDFQVMFLLVIKIIKIWQTSTLATSESIWFQKSWLDVITFQVRRAS